MWNFLFLVLPPSLGSKKKKKGRRGLCWSGLFSKYWDLFSLTVLYPHLPPQPPQPHPDSARHAFVVPFSFAKDGDQSASIVYCSSVMVWKQPSAEAFDICGHINQGCHTACLPSQPPNPTGSHPCPWPQPLLSPRPSLPNLKVCHHQQYQWQ